MVALGKPRLFARRETHGTATGERILQSPVSPCLLGDCHWGLRLSISNHCSDEQ